MSGTPFHSGKLSLAEKFTRLRARLKQPEWRRYGRLLLAGKAMGVAIVFFTILGALAYPDRETIQTHAGAPVIIG